MKKKKQGDSPVVYSALEVANICGVVNQTAINWIRSGYLKAFTTPGGQFRVYPDDLASFMQERDMRVPDEVMVQCRNNQILTNMLEVLVVDDDEAFNNVIKSYLEQNIIKIKIYQAFDGFEAGIKMMENHPQLLVLDLGLPGVNGIKLIRNIRESEKFGKPEIIVITGSDDPETERECHELGVYKFFKKPLVLSELYDSIKQLFPI